MPPPDATAPPRTAVSVVMPVLNERRHLREAVSRVLEQDLDGDLEVVLALGPSTDGTDEVAAELAAADRRVRLVTNPSGRTPNGLNAAVAASSHPVIARVDGHAVLPPDYLRTAVALLEVTGADNVGGVMDAQGVSDVERAVAAAMRSRLGVGSARFHTGGEAGPAETVYLGVFRREALTRVGGYDEHFARAQDWELNHRIRSTGGTVWFTPDLRVTYRPRADLGALARQYFQYGRWRRAVARRHPGTMSLRYLAPPALVTVLAGSLLAARARPVTLLVPAGYVGALVAGSLTIEPGLPPRARALLPAVLGVMHVSWGVGFLTSRVREAP
ncbi:MAG TPA: glycosyltransferase family 2 protein [Actinomycetales bacterium]|jgi:glycosyltransferase involved in cell wall biosynthesis